MRGPRRSELSSRAARRSGQRATALGLVVVVVVVVAGPAAPPAVHAADEQRAQDQTEEIKARAHFAVGEYVSIHGHTATAALHGPLLQTSATGDVTGLPLQRMTFEMSQVQTFLGVIDGGNHVYIQQNDGGAQRPAIIAWLRYWVYKDTGGRNYFYGDNCVMCGAPNWTTMFQRKNWQ